MKAIILARVSTEEQMNEGQSIPAQLSRAREYTKTKGLTIYKEFPFDESSVKDQRKKFEKVIEEIEKSKEKVALIVETVDRLQRSFKESVMLDEFRKQDKLEIHFIRENLVIHKESNSSEIQRWDLAVFVAKSFVLQISDNVKRTFALKIKNGEWPGKAPIGYVNVKDENGSRRDIVPDSTRSHYLPKVFEMYSTGNYSIRQIQGKIESLGLRGTKEGKPISSGMIYLILKNPFYYGEMQIKKGSYKGIYPHKYQPMIKKELFDKCQEVMAGYNKKPFKYASKPFIFRGLIKCAKCGCTITGETAKGHVYYSCTNYRKVHKKRVYIKEEELLAPIYDILEGIRLPDDKIQEITDDLRKMNENKNEFQKRELANLRKEYDQIGKRVSRMWDLRLDNPSITETMFNEKLKEYKEKQAELNERIQGYTDADESFYLTANTVLNVAKRAREVFESSEVAEKGQLLNFLLQNLRLKGRKLLFDLKTPFDTVLQANKCSNLLRRQDSNLQPYP